MKLTRSQEKQLRDLVPFVQKNEYLVSAFIVIGLAQLGVKNNFTLERVKKDNLPVIYKFMEKANLSYKFSTQSGINKVIAGTSKKEVERIYNLEPEIFSQNTKEEEVYEYGRLMGYPKCCSRAMAGEKIKYDVINAPGYHYMIQNPWPWTLSFLEPLVWHIPCSSDCSKSIRIGRLNSFLRKKFLPNFTTSHPLNIYDLQVLHFRDNLNLFFRGTQDGDTTKVEEILDKNIRPHTERTNSEEDLKEAVQFIKDIKINDTLSINDEIIKLGNRKSYEKEDISDGCLIKFTN